MRTALLASVVGVFALVIGAHAQERLDLSISSGGIFGKSVSQTTSSVSLTPHFSGPVFGTVRYHFTNLQAVEINVGHADSSQLFTKAPDTYRISGTLLEYSGAYVLTPMHDHRLQPFLFAGGGGLQWSVSNQYIDQVSVNLGAGRQSSLAFLYGGGADYRLWRNLALRLQYRGLIYRAPDFGVSTLFISGKDHMAEPAAGLVIKF